MQAIQRDPQREIRSGDLRSISIEGAPQSAWMKVTYRPAKVTTADLSNLAEQLAEPTTPPDPATYRGGCASGTARSPPKPGCARSPPSTPKPFPVAAPTKAVKEAFGLAPSTASLYVKRARDAGLL